MLEDRKHNQGLWLLSKIIQIVPIIETASEKLTTKLHNFSETGELVLSYVSLGRWGGDCEYLCSKTGNIIRDYGSCRRSFDLHISVRLHKLFVYSTTKD